MFIDFKVRFRSVKNKWFSADYPINIIVVRDLLENNDSLSRFSGLRTRLFVKQLMKMKFAEMLGSIMLHACFQMMHLFLSRRWKSGLFSDC